MTFRIENETEVKDFIRGVTLLGVGGGGNPLLGIKRMTEVLNKNGVIEMQESEDFPDDEWTCCVFGMGSIAPNADKPGAYGQFERATNDPNICALEELEKLTGKTISAVVAFEPGGVNTSIGLHAGAMLGKTMIDGDYSGRAVPELCQTGPVIYGEKITPVAICDDWGNVIHVQKAAGNDALEAIGKQISIVTKAPDKFAICAHAGMLLSGREMKKYIIPHTMSNAFKLGKAIREAREAGGDAAEAAAKQLCGKVLFKGTVSAKDFVSTGYMTGNTSINGSGLFGGETFKVWYRNENHLAWRNERVVAMSPDLIAIMNAETGEPITNSNLAVGDSVAVIGAPHKPYRTPEAIKLNGPRYFGFDMDYVPIEEL